MSDRTPTNDPTDTLFRVRDLLVAGPALVLLAPVFAAVGIAVLVDSGRPVFFHQERVGRYGESFRIHKFRTMVTNRGGLAVTSDNDTRITRVGRWLRASKVDELPQLWNVLVGEMSLVGPRPEVPTYVALWPASLRPGILSVRPGITDPMTVEMRHESTILAAATDPERTYVDELLPAKARGYAQYVEGRTFQGDLGIVLRTIRAIIGPPSPKSHFGQPRSTLRATGGKE